MVLEKNFCRGAPNTLVTLTHLYPLVTFRLKPFLFWHLTREGMRGGPFPEVT
jgi:hypothetical protein